MSVARKKSAISSTGHAGLRIITQISLGESNIVVKSGLKSLTRTTPNSLSLSSVISSNKMSDNDGDYCFLRSCQLCNKLLSPDKDVYMYRGDQGFCSLECRNRQIMVDEAKEREARITKKMVAAANSTKVHDCRGCETCRLLKDLRQQRHRRNYIKPLISSTKQQPLLSIFS